MGEIADSLIDGEFDYISGEYIGPGVGYPRTSNGRGYRKSKDSDSQKKFRAIRKEIALRAKELTASGMNENAAVNEARKEANIRYGHEWRNLQYR